MTSKTTNLARLLAVVAVTGSAALAACGGSPATTQKRTDADAVRQVLTDLQTASRAGDGRRICTQIFTPKLADSVTKSASSGSCATEVKRKLFSPNEKITVENVDVTDPANATATVKEANGNRSTVFLVKQSDRWRIRSVQAA
jgi:hypothetical protein